MQYRKYHCADETVVRSCYLHNGSGKIIFLYWIHISVEYKVSTVCITCGPLSLERARFQRGMLPTREVTSPRNGYGCGVRRVNFHPNRSIRRVTFNLNRSIKFSQKWVAKYENFTNITQREAQNEKMLPNSIFDIWIPNQRVFPGAVHQGLKSLCRPLPVAMLGIQVDVVYWDW